MVWTLSTGHEDAFGSFEDLHSADLMHQSCQLFTLSHHASMAWHSAGIHYCKWLGAAKGCNHFELLALRRIAIIRMCDLKSRFHEAELGTTAAAYAGCKLAALTPSKRGLVLETVAKAFLKKLEPNSIIIDPVPSETKCNGTRRGVKQAEYDWLHDGRRIQCKSSQVYWDASRRRWQACFRRIRPGWFDELLLVLYVPGQLHFFCHDFQAGLSPAESSARMHALSVCGPRGCEDLNNAQPHLTSRLHESLSCKFVGMLGTRDELLEQSLRSDTRSLKFDLEFEAFHQHPLGSHISPSSRGRAIQNLVQEVDSLLHRGAACVKGTTYDWCRSGVRVECKHSRMAWKKNTWVCAFGGVKSHNFDLLYLAIDTPTALRILQFGGSKFVQSQGLRGEVEGIAIQVGGIAGLRSWSDSADAITNKLVAAGSTHVATVMW